MLTFRLTIKSAGISAHAVMYLALYRTGFPSDGLSALSGRSFGDLHGLRRAVSGIVSYTVLDLVGPYLYIVCLSLDQSAERFGCRILPFHCDDLRSAHVFLKTEAHHVSAGTFALVVRHGHLSC